MKNLDSVLTAASGLQALRLVTMCKCDIVVLDFEMPGMNGYEVAYKIKLVRSELMVILLSGSVVSTNASALVDAFIPKLEANIRKHFDRYLVSRYSINRMVFFALAYVEITSASSAHQTTSRYAAPFASHCS